MAQRLGAGLLQAYMSGNKPAYSCKVAWCAHGGGVSAVHVVARHTNARLPCRHAAGSTCYVTALVIRTDLANQSAMWDYPPHAAAAGISTCTHQPYTPQHNGSLPDAPACVKRPVHSPWCQAGVCVLRPLPLVDSCLCTPFLVLFLQWVPGWQGKCLHGQAAAGEG